MSTTLSWRPGELSVDLDIDTDHPVRLLRLHHTTAGAAELPEGAPLAEVALHGDGRVSVSGNTIHHRYATSRRLRYVSHTATDDALAVVQQDPDTGLRVTVHLEHLGGALRTRTVVDNAGDAPVRLGFVSSLVLSGFVDPPTSAYPDGLRVHYAHNAWVAEFRWQEASLDQAGLVDIGVGRRVFSLASRSTWSTGDFLAAGGIQHSSGTGWAWQVEHNGAWQWQLSEHGKDVYLSVSGPTDAEHQWAVDLAPGESFETVPAAIAVSAEGFHGALRVLNRYRRLIRRDSPDNRELPVIFNDYMNCLWGDPTADKEIPLIPRAARLGAEYFVIDAGWYADDGGWWETVGAWQPSTTRFGAEGLRGIIDRIHAAGMRPGLWVEPEVVGVDSPLATELPDDAFFHLDGRRVFDHGRYQLDYRHPAVVARMDKVIDGLIDEYGVGYFKFDYNISPGSGTDVGGVAPGHGLLGHNRAFLAWLDGIFVRHPDLVIENCSSGGMRVDYAQLSRMSIQSTSDQTDPLKYVPIAVAAPSAVTPEQSAVWSYPQPDWSDAVNVLTMTSSLLGRVHLSGRIDQLSPDQFSLVSEGIQLYKAIRPRLAGADPYWPLGLPHWYDDHAALALRDGRGTLLAAYRRGGGDTLRIPLPWLTGRETVEVRYATAATATLTGTTLELTLPESPSACLIEITTG